MKRGFFQIRLGVPAGGEENHFSSTCWAWFGCCLSCLRVQGKGMEGAPCGNNQSSTVELLGLTP